MYLFSLFHEHNVDNVSGQKSKKETSFLIDSEVSLEDQKSIPMGRFSVFKTILFMWVKCGSNFLSRDGALSH